MLEIVKTPDSILSQKTKPVTKIDKGILKLIKQMKESLDAATDPIGVGLAAPQVGKSLKIFIAKPNVKSKVLTFINPRIIKSKEELSKEPQQKPAGQSPLGGARKLEGCLSLPNIWGEVQRYNEIQLEYQDESGKMHNKKFTGFISTIIQHEIDHLKGVLFPKRVLEQKRTLYKSEKDKNGEDVFEELKI